MPSYLVEVTMNLGGSMPGRNGDPGPTGPPGASGLNSWFDVKTAGAVGDGTTDDTAAIASANTGAHTAGGVVYFPPGIYKVSSTFNITRADVQWIGTGAAGTIIQPTNHGDCLYVKMATLIPDQRTSRIEGLSFEGTHAQSDTVAVHYGDTTNGTIEDVGFYNFTGGSAIGLWVENQASSLYTEGLVWKGVEFSNNTTGIVFDRTSPSNLSMGYHDMISVRLTVGVGQTGIVIRNGVSLYNGFFRIKANLAPDSGTTFLKLEGIPTNAGFTTMDGDFHIAVEQTGGSPGVANGIVITDGAVLSGHGRIDLSGNAPVSALTSGIVNLQGWMQIPGFPDNALPSTHRIVGYTVGSPATHFPTTPSTVGQIYYELTPISGGYVGWICTTAGTPGTWKQFGAIL